MRIRDWSSDVCSSDLAASRLHVCAATKSASTTPCAASQVSRPLNKGTSLPGLSGRCRSAISQVGVRRGSLTRPEEQTSELQSLMRTPYAVLCLKQQTHN